MQEMIEEISEIAREAGDEILRVYDKIEVEVETKDDNSPLTEADLASHHLIVSRLQVAFPEIPVLSEESTDVTWAERSSWSKYFLIDPLDGTKEFINRNGEFTVNIALISDNEPVAGVVFVPVKNVLYAGYQGDSSGTEAPAGCAYVDRDGSITPIKTRPVPSDELVIVASRRHGGDALQECLKVLEKNFSNIDTRNMGSSLKLCLVAEGVADFYPRLAPTSEWDTGAAHAVVLAAGGVVVDVHFDPLRYNVKEDILNPHFYVIGDPNFNWQQMLKA